MLLNIDLGGFKIEQGEDCNFQKEIKASMCNDTNEPYMMILNIEGIEYLFDKNEFKKVINILEME